MFQVFIFCIFHIMNDQSGGDPEVLYRKKAGVISYEKRNRPISHLLSKDVEK